MSDIFEMLSERALQAEAQRDEAEQERDELKLRAEKAEEFIRRLGRLKDYKIEMFGEGES